MIAIKDSVAQLIVEMEKTALERWNNGDPFGFIEISSNDVVYFDPFSASRIDGLDNLTEIYESIRGKIRVDRYELINPKVQEVERMAVLTYNLLSYSGEECSKWNCTEVYRLEQNGEWRIVQTHWSLTKPEFK